MGEDKKYYWLKIKEDWFEDDTIEWIEDQPNGKEYSLFYLKLCLKSLRSNGILIRVVGEMLIPYDAKKLAELTRTDFDTVVVAMELFKKIGLIQILENGEIFLTQLNEIVGSETDKAIIMRKKRALEKAKSNNVTELLPTCYLEIEKETKKIEKRDKSLEKKKKETYVSVIDSYTSNDELKASLKDYVETRKQTKGFTVRALKLNLNELDKLASDDLTKRDIVNQSIIRTWKGFFPLKKDYRREEIKPEWMEKQDNVSEEEKQALQEEMQNWGKEEQAEILIKSYEHYLKWGNKEKAEETAKEYRKLTGKDIPA